jgi:hypothetical protein
MFLFFVAYFTPLSVANSSMIDELKGTVVA